MIVMQFVLGRDTRTPVSVSIQEDDAAVAMHQFQQIFNGYVRIANEAENGVEDNDDGEEGGGSGFGPGSFPIN